MIVAGPQTASGTEPPLALESAERGLGLGPEDAVFAPGVEAERVEATLELADVVAAQHRSMHVEQAVAERVAALDQRAPGLGSADPVDAHTAASLELAHGREGLLPEAAIQRDGVTTLREALLEVPDGVSTIAEAQESVGHAQTMNLKQ